MDRATANYYCRAFGVNEVPPGVDPQEIKLTAAEIAQHFSPLLTTGQHKIPGPPELSRAYRIKVTIVGRAMLATIEDIHRRQCITIGIAPDDAAAEELWPELEKLYLRVTELPGHRAADFAAPKRPESTPWCAAITIHASADEAYWMSDFERCLAWAWIENR